MKLTYLIPFIASLVRVAEVSMFIKSVRTIRGVITHPGYGLLALTTTDNNSFNYYIDLIIILCCVKLLKLCLQGAVVRGQLVSSITSTIDSNSGINN